MWSASAEVHTEIGAHCLSFLRFRFLGGRPRFLRGGEIEESSRKERAGEKEEYGRLSSKSDAVGETESCGEEERSKEEGGSDEESSEDSGDKGEDEGGKGEEEGAEEGFEEKRQFDNGDERVEGDKGES